jgi:hypothetical protein
MVFLQMGLRLVTRNSPHLGARYLISVTVYAVVGYVPHVPQRGGYVSNGRRRFVQDRAPRPYRYLLAPADSRSTVGVGYRYGVASNFLPERACEYMYRSVLEDWDVVVRRFV